MAHFHNPSILGSSGNQNLQYRISRSLRFNSADSAYLSRTPGSAGNRKTWTFSCWVKRAKLGVTQNIFDAAESGTSNPRTDVSFSSSDTFNFQVNPTGSAWLTLTTTQVFRDVSAWGHLVIAVDTTQATDTNRVKIYWNGTQITQFSTAQYPSQNTDLPFNNTWPHSIGRYQAGAVNYFDGYIADVYLLDGTATTPSTFAETDAITGQWVPKTPTGISYGTNGFRLTFSDNSGTTSTTLGKDSAGSNNWTPNNFSVASGSGNDSLTDSPTSYGTDTGTGGEVRGNYSTLNPLSTVSDTLSNGNLDWVSGIAASRITKNTIAVSTGKWYAEFLYTGSTTNGTVVGICEVSATGNGGLPTTGYMYYQNGNKYINSTGSAYGSSWANGDLIGIALNLDSNQVTFYKNNTSQGAISITSGLTWVFCCIGSSANDNATWNFGARAFSYTAPSGFKALVDTNLTAPTIAKPANYFDITLWTGNSTNGRAITGLAFQPEFVWIKRRSASYANILSDAVRGFGSTGWAKQLISDSTAAEDTGTVNTISSFDTGGFTLGVDGGVNFSGSTYVGWCWDAASSNSTNTQGSITSTIRASATSGFSVVTFTSPTGTGNFSVGHGLGATPEFVIVKSRDAVGVWYVYHKSLATDYYLRLNGTNAAATDGVQWGAGMTSSVLGFRASYSTVSGATTVAYAFAPVAGYSAFGSYTGNGSSDGPFVFTGHRSRWLMVKRTDVSDSWYIYDTARNTYNVSNLALYAQSSLSEQTETANIFDVLSNGFKVRGSGGGSNVNGGTYVYASFAEFPFAYARAR